MPKTQQERRCLLSGASLPRHALLRFVAAEGRLLPDIRQRLSGRGMWVASDRKILERALEERLFDRPPKDGRARPLEVEEDMASLIEERLLAHASQALGLAAKAGRILYGGEAYARAMKRSRGRAPPLALHSCSPQERGVARGRAPALSLFSGEEMAKIFGRSPKRIALIRTPKTRHAFEALWRYALYLGLDVGLDMGLGAKGNEGEERAR